MHPSFRYFVSSAIFSLLLLVACGPTAPESTTTGTPVEEPGYPGPTAVPTHTPYPPGYPPPTTESLPPTGGATVVIEVELSPGVFGAPIEPQPTRTPEPTPTRRPGPTPTAVPLKPPPDSPAGVIRYTTQLEPTNYETYGHFAIQIDAEGRPAVGVEAIPLPLASEFRPYQIHVSPNGNYVVMMRPFEPGGLPYVVNQLTGEVIIPFDDGGNFYGWHPDGRHFLFSILGEGLFLIDAETLEITTLALPVAPVYGAAVSPDGQIVAFITLKWPDPMSALWLVSVAGSDAQAIFDTGQISDLESGPWSPDGSQLIYGGRCPDSTGQERGPLCIANIQTMDRRLLDLPFISADEPLDWSPDGRYLVGIGLTEDGTLCDSQRRQSEPIACQYKGISVYVIDTVTDQAKALAEGISPVWSPDGSMVAFLSNRSGAPEIWTIRVDGTGLQQLTSDGLYKVPYGNLTWSER